MVPCAVPSRAEPTGPPPAGVETESVFDLRERHGAGGLEGVGQASFFSNQTGVCSLSLDSPLSAFFPAPPSWSLSMTLVTEPSPFASPSNRSSCCYSTAAWSPSSSCNASRAVRSFSVR